MPIEDQALREADRYAAKRPRRVVSGNCSNYPALHWLYRHAALVRVTRPQAKRFIHQGVQYSIIWLGLRMCVMHVRTSRVLVGAPGAGDHE